MLYIHPFSLLVLVVVAATLFVVLMPDPLPVLFVRLRADPSKRTLQGALGRPAGSGDSEATRALRTRSGKFPAGDLTIVGLLRAAARLEDSLCPQIATTNETHHCLTERGPRYGRVARSPYTLSFF